MATLNRGATVALAVEAEGLQKNYRGHQALRGVDLAVPEGSVLALLGPNGAGKTTTTRILATLCSLDGGRAVVAGHDVVREPQQVRRQIGVTGQYAALDDLLTGRENLRLVGRLLHLSRRQAARRAEDLLQQMGLVEAADRPTGTYSGGMRRRLDLAGSLVGDPPVLFLDEPTTGLDPTSRLTLWDMVRRQVRSGMSVLLTTQYLEEAEQLADRVVVIDHGQVVAEGTPEDLTRAVGGDWIEVSFTSTDDLYAALAVVSRAADGLATVREDRCSLTVAVPPGLGTVAAVSTALSRSGLQVDQFVLRRPSLDDVFVQLTGRERGGPS
ncbi:MAG TPA: ATP-binding cassette domain-containing protein [Kineosporiaceae bacterium]